MEVGLYVIKLNVCECVRMMSSDGYVTHMSSHTHTHTHTHTHIHTYTHTHTTHTHTISSHTHIHTVHPQIQPRERSQIPKSPVIVGYCCTMAGFFCQTDKIYTLTKDSWCTSYESGQSGCTPHTLCVLQRVAVCCSGLQWVKM